MQALAELFRERGYDGASLSLIGAATGLGKGSLYNFFPGGKQEMLEAVLEEIEGWFEAHVFTPLEAAPAPGNIAQMFDAIDAYFRSGRRVCLVGVLALGDGSADRFGVAVQRYFKRWVDTLGAALARSGHDGATAGARAVEIVAGIQGAIVLARALADPGVFARCLATLRLRV